MLAGYLSFVFLAGAEFLYSKLSRELTQCGRGESDVRSPPGYYCVPLLLTTGDEFLPLTSEDQVVAALQQQVDGMRAAAYARSEVLDSEVPS
jgi:uncharacterized NTF2-like protein DUF6841